MVLQSKDGKPSSKKLWARARRASLAQVHKTREASALKVNNKWAKVDQSPAERVHRHRLLRVESPDGVQTLSWTVDTALVRMEALAFGEGAMRKCFRTKKVVQVPTNNVVHPSLWASSTRYVAKVYKQNPLERRQYFEDVAMQAEAELWAEMYNQLNPPKKIDMLQTLLVECVDRADRPIFAMERFIAGSYVKHNSNSGFVDAQACRLTPHCFSHFTFHRSRGALMVVDIQGVNDLYTDPQIHTCDRRYGAGDMGYFGMALFLATHRCSPLCRLLSIPSFGTEPSVAHTPGPSVPGTVVSEAGFHHNPVHVNDRGGKRDAAGKSAPVDESPAQQQQQRHTGDKPVPDPEFSMEDAMQALVAQKEATARALAMFVVGNAGGAADAAAADNEKADDASNQNDVDTAATKAKARLLDSDPFGHVAAVHAALARVLLDAREAASVAGKGVAPNRDADAIVATQHLLRCVELSAPRLKEASEAADEWQKQKQKQQQQQQADDDDDDDDDDDNDNDDDGGSKQAAEAKNGREPDGQVCLDVPRIDEDKPVPQVFVGSRRGQATAGDAPTRMAEPLAPSQQAGPSLYPSRHLARAWLALALAHSGELPASQREQDEAALWRDGDGDAYGVDGCELRSWAVGRACRPHDAGVAQALWEGAARLGAVPALIKTAQQHESGGDGVEKDWKLAAARLERAVRLMSDKGGASDYEPPQPVFAYKEKLADLLSTGGHGLEQDKDWARDLYMEAGNQAMVVARDMFGSQRCFGKAAMMDA